MEISSLSKYTFESLVKLEKGTKKKEENRGKGPEHGRLVVIPRLTLLLTLLLFLIESGSNMFLLLPLLSNHIIETTLSYCPLDKC
jgi:hypothetical protein